MLNINLGALMNSRINNPIGEYAGGVMPEPSKDDESISPKELSTPSSPSVSPNSISNSNEERGIPESPGDSDGKEARQIRFLQTIVKETNFVFLFGAAQRGKTVVTSSVVNFLSSVDAMGNLAPFRLKPKSDADEGRKLFDRIRRLHAQQRFPERTTLVGDREPIYVNIAFSPNKELDSEPLRLTFLEMPGEDLKAVDSPDGVGELPPTINAFMRVEGLKPAFILITSPDNAFDDDQLMSSFIDYICELDSRFDASRFLLLITKWDTYGGALSPAEFVAENMKLTNAKLFNPKHSIAAFSIGAVDVVGGNPFLKRYEPSYAKAVVNWLYMEFTGKPLYRRSAWRKILDGFRRFG